MELLLDKHWKSLLKTEFEKDYFINLISFLEEEYSNKDIFPSKELIFNAFNLCSLHDIKVVILGQDPYHGEGQANGLAFSVPDSVALPPSLKNIFKEINMEFDRIMQPSSGNLESWAKQGVLLINATLTVEAHKAGSHQKRGWEVFTDSVIETISAKTKGVVFLLWGGFAQKKEKLIDESKHLILKSVHPSPLSANRGGWFGCNHFIKVNEYLRAQNKSQIYW